MAEIPRYERTRRPARTGRGPRLPIEQPSGGTRALSEAFGFLGQLAAKRDESEAVSFASRVSAEAARHFSIRLPEAQRQAPEGAAGFAGAMDVEIQEYVADALKAAPSDLAREMAGERLSKFQVELFEGAVTFEAAAGRNKYLVDFDRGLDALSVAAFNDPGGSGKYLAQARGDLVAADDTWMLPNDVSERRSRLAPAIATAAVKGLIATEPRAAVAALDGGVFDAGLDAVIKAALKKSATEAVDAIERESKAAVKAAEAAAKKAKKEARAATQNDYLARLKDPGQKPPSVREILASNLEPVGQGSKKTFVDLIEKKLQGEDLNFTDPRVYRDRQEKIANGEITDSRALLADIGNGLSITDYERLEGDIEKARTVKGKAELALKEQALDRGRRRLTTTDNFLGIKDPEGEDRIDAFRRDLEDALQDGEMAGKTWKDMTDPRHPDFITDKLIELYEEGPREMLRRQVRTFAGEAGEAAGDAPDLRKPGETIAEWRKRTGN